MQILGTHHVALYTANFAALRQFYTEVLGLAEVGNFPGMNIIFLNAGSTMIELVEATDNVSGAGGWAHLALHVPDVDAAAQELAALGVHFHVAPMHFPPDAPTLRIAFFKDPDGNEVELLQML